ncbi:Acetyltransferase (GNAT) family protein [Pseudoruegeria aquimaris]|uniref:Acetyltransferase (GNAT) family protein n=1 Tax=Pseudoruegeria aquimaris TaxID=393663 RepID=A0A1Y5RHV7_9RHOB|nr:GNAT family N-acetyltransferase [Pseudoruegeria aquimaris]SLN17503.1 Acetyltransferase (GNAT) family protein [Pseudoruegeria aquimaris]
MADVSPPFVIRPARPGDLAAVDALLARAYPALLKPDYPPSVLVTALPLISRARPELLASGTYYVAQAEDGAILGAGGFTAQAPGGAARRPGLGHIRHVVTDPHQLRRGIGAALMARSFAEARGAGLAALACQSTLTAEPFYAACGFERLGRITVPLARGIDFPAIAMQRAL